MQPEPCLCSGFLVSQLELDRPSYWQPNSPPVTLAPGELPRRPLPFSPGYWVHKPEAPTKWAGWSEVCLSASSHWARGKDPSMPGLMSRGSPGEGDAGSPTFPPPPVRLITHTPPPGNLHFLPFSQSSPTLSPYPPPIPKKSVY